MRQRSGATVIARDGAARAGMTVPNAILQLQATVGNRAVGRMLGRLPVQRLWDAEAFKEQTDAGFGVLRGTTLKAIDGLLARYNDPDGLDMNRKLMTATLSDLNRAAMILEHVIEDTRIWMNNHEDDTSRDRHRMVGIRQLNLDATQERAAVENRRAAKAAENNWVPLPIKASDEVNHIREKFENVSAKSALEKLSFLIDLAVPDIGSKGEVEAMVDIPVEPSGVGFIGFRFKAAAERSERNKMKVRMEVSLTGGAQIGGDLMRVAAEIGGYLEAAGQDSKQVMQAISYGLYRKFRESQVLPRGAANFIWGGTTSTAIGYKQSEKWSAQVEKELFGKNKDAYVEMGAMGGASIESGISGVGKGKLAAQVGGGTRWNKDSIADIAKAKGQWDDASIDALGDEVVKLSQAGKTPLLENKEFLEVLVAMGWKKSRVWQLAKKADKSGDYSKNGIVAVAKKLSDSRGRAALGETHKYSAVGGAQKSRGEHTAYMQVTGDLDIGPATLGAKLDMSWTSKGRDKMRASHFREGKLEVKGGLKLPMAKALGGEWLLMLVGEKSINALNQMSRALLEKAPDDAKKKDDNAARNVGRAAVVGQDYAHMITQFASVPTESFKAELKSVDALKQGFSGASAFMIVIDGKIKARPAPDKPLPYEINIAVVEEKSIKIEGGVARASAKTSQRLIRIQFKDGKWSVEGGGAESTPRDIVKPKAAKALPSPPKK